MAYVTDTARVERAFPAFCLRVVMVMIEKMCPLSPDAPEEAKKHRDAMFSRIIGMLQNSVDAVLGDLPLAQRQKLERRVTRRVGSVFGPVGEVTPLVALKTAHEVVQAVLNTGGWEPDEYYVDAFNEIADFVYGSAAAVEMIDKAEHEAILTARDALRRLQSDGYYTR